MQTKAWYKDGQQMFWKCGTVQIFGTTTTNQNLIQEKIERRLYLGNICYHSVQNFCLLVCCIKHKN
jgi:hypothetical protein